MAFFHAISDVPKPTYLAHPIRHGYVVAMRTKNVKIGRAGEFRSKSLPYARKAEFYAGVNIALQSRSYTHIFGRRMWIKDVIRTQ